MATSKQAKKLIEVFEDLDNELMQRILGSGVLALVRDRPELAEQFLNVGRGLAEIRPIEHAIDRGKTPKLPFDGATIEAHKGSGVSKFEPRADGLYLDGRKIVFHLDRAQKNGTIGGHDLRKRLAKQEVLDASILDYLMEHQELIPEDWKKDEKDNTHYIFFWGTIFRSSLGCLYVRYLYWHDGKWRVNCGWLGHGWYANNPAAVLAS